MKKHILTQEDLDNDPELVGEGLQVGDEIEFEKLPKEKGDKGGYETYGEEEGGDDSKGGGGHDPIGGDPIKP